MLCTFQAALTRPPRIVKKSQTHAGTVLALPRSRAGRLDYVGWALQLPALG